MIPPPEGEAGNVDKSDDNAAMNKCPVFFEF
jgi:hypothetical protein